MATLSQLLTICKVTIFYLVPPTTPSIIYSPLPLEASDPCDDFHEYFPQLPTEYLIPLLVSAKPLPFPSILHIG